MAPKIQGMLERQITERLQATIAQVPAVALLGARQVGKTTLAKTIAKDIDSIYLDLEAPEDLLKLSDPSSFLSGHADKLVILDEIQRSPELFLVLRGLIDKSREQGRRAAQFLLLGSASIMPGKVNPVIPEMVNQVAYQVMGNDLTVMLACEGG